MGTTPLIDGQRGESHRSRLTLGASPECVGDVPSVLLQWAIALPPDGGSSFSPGGQKSFHWEGFPPGKPRGRGVFFCVGGAVMNRATRNELLISYMEHMEKAEQAPGWRESVKHFQDAAELAEQIRSSSRPARGVA